MANMNIVWKHFDTYSIIRKQRTMRDKVFDLAIMPALMLKNCMPMKIMVTVSGYQ